MWLFTEYGFFSAVEAYPDLVPDGKETPHVMVRARVREDLENVQALYEEFFDMSPPSIMEFNHSDYRYRIVMDSLLWGFIVMQMMARVNYTNFKHRVAEKQGPQRAAWYESVWATLWSMGRELEK